MRAGTMRNKVVIQSLTTSQDAYGGVTESWATFDTVWADIQYLTGNELWRAQQANSQAQGKVKIRYRTGILPTMRVKHGDDYLEIISVLPADNKGKELELLFKRWLD